jgi:hypothetical protein
MVFSSIVNAWLFGEFAILMDQLGSEDAQFQEKIDAATGSMLILKLDDDLKKEVRTYYVKTR